MGQTIRLRSTPSLPCAPPVLPPLAVRRPPVFHLFQLVFQPCAAEGCKKHPHFGHIEGGPRYCAQHRAEGMVDVKHRRCAVKSCRKDRVLIPGSTSKRGKFCEVHCDVNELVDKDVASSDGASTTNDKKRSRAWIPDM